MALPSSGSISIYQIAVELGIGAEWLNLNDSRVRTLAGAWGQISMSQLWGKDHFSWSVNTTLVPEIVVRAGEITYYWDIYYFELVPGDPGVTVTSVSVNNASYIAWRANELAPLPRLNVTSYVQAKGYAVNGAGLGFHVSPVHTNTNKTVQTAFTVSAALSNGLTISLTLTPPRAIRNYRTSGSAG